MGSNDGARGGARSGTKASGDKGSATGKPSRPAKKGPPSRGAPRKGPPAEGRVPNGRPSNAQAAKAQAPKAQAPKGQGASAPKSLLGVVIDGVPMDDAAARALWVEFSLHLDEHKNDFDGFAKVKGYASVRPEHQKGRAVLVIAS